MLNHISPLKGWGAFDKTGQQSQYLRRVELSLNKTKDCVCKAFYFLETNVGLDNQDTCGGDSGESFGIYLNLSMNIRGQRENNNQV